MFPQLTSPPDARPDVIVLDDVTKRFVIRKDNSLKERLVTFGRAGRKHREDFWALRGVTATIKAGTTIGLIGHNGSGKSTLLKVIGGIIDPTSGSVSRRGRIAALLELGAGFHPDLTGRENVFLNAAILGLSRKETEERFDDIAEFSGIGDFIDTQVKFYSSGMYVRLAFAVAVHTDPDILLVDEVLAVGDEAFQRKCLDKIRTFQQEGRTIILVTHSLAQVMELCDKAILLNRGEVVYNGESHEAVARFRDILEERRIDDLAKHADPEQDLVVPRILETTIHAAGRAEGDRVEHGDDLIIRTTFEYPSLSPEWVAAIQMDNAHGQVVYGTRSDLIGHDLEPFEGRRTVEFRLNNVQLGTGKYFINVSLLDRSNRHLADHPQAVAFNVAYYPKATGTSYLEPEFSDLGSEQGPLATR
ncbi:ABC transporter ATP-binding protein [Leifsonia aquatica]|uniref:ABC transporter ATP-binding protein n=1 Tax=Leifsonia aquatica TaxID=144185 RepID=UPI0005B9C833|nr:ABC transporter ATP-binding protein [Leifsonia aquatica]